MRKHRGLLITLFLVVALCGVSVVVLSGSSYPADEAAVTALASTPGVTVAETADGIVFLPAEPIAGFIFYPGGLVEPTAYAPLLHALAEEGVLCVLVEMPLNLAVLDMNAADGIIGQYPQVTRWSIGGHSLGGAMAASYAAAHPEDFAALALLAAYSPQPLPESLSVVSVYGTADTVLNWDKYVECRANLPAHAEEIAIPGGSHAQFGSYGTQRGDGVPTITPEAQRNAAVQALLPALTGETADPGE